jgi:two-component system response regulator MprA
MVVLARQRQARTKAGRMNGIGARILVVDDDPMLAAALRRPLAYEGYDVEVAVSGEDALTRVSERAPDLVVLDVGLPGMDGLATCRRLRSVTDVPVLMLTARGEVAERVAGFEAGADDYLGKPFAFEELLMRVRALLRRGRNGASNELKFADLRLDRSTREVWRGDRSVALTRQEFDLLALFLEHPRQVLTRSTILERVWDYDFGRDSNVLEVYVGYLRRKLESGGEPRMISTVRGVGYVLREEQGS